MAKWIAFEDADVSALSQHAPKHEVEVGIGDPLMVAVASEAPALVMLPGADGRITTVTIRPARKSDRQPQHYIATGFLGLTDTVAEDDELLEEEPKPWWRRILRQ